MSNNIDSGLAGSGNQTEATPPTSVAYEAYKSKGYRYLVLVLHRVRIPTRNSYGIPDSRTGTRRPAGSDRARARVPSDTPRPTTAFSKVVAERNPRLCKRWSSPAGPGAITPQGARHAPPLGFKRTGHMTRPRSRPTSRRGSSPRTHRGCSPLPRRRTSRLAEDNSGRGCCRRRRREATAVER